MAQRISPFASLKPIEKDLDFVAGSAGDNWRSLLTHLGIEYATIESFQNGGGTKDACFKGLHHWLNGNVPDETVTFDTLFQALKDSAMTGCISLLEEKLKARSRLNRADQDLSTQPNNVLCSRQAVVHRVTGSESRPSSVHSSGFSELTDTVISAEEIAASRLGIAAALDRKDRWRAKDPPHRRLHEAFFRLQSRLAKLFNKHIDDLKTFLRICQKSKEWPYKLLEVEDIDKARTFQAIFDKVRIEKFWLNTDMLIRLSDALPDKKSHDKAKQHLEAYHKLLGVFSKFVLLKHIPEDDARLEHFRSRMSPKLLRVRYDVDIEDFAVSELLKQQEFLCRIFKIPKEAFRYLEATEGDSVDKKSRHVSEECCRVLPQMPSPKPLLQDSVPLSEPGVQERTCPSDEFLMEQDENVHQEDSASNSWLKQYEKVIQEQGSVTVQITRCVLIGPARVGKSCLKQLLVHNEPRPVHKSTDVMEAPVVLTSMYHSEKSVWKVLTVNNLLKGLNKCTAEGEYNSPPHQPSTAPHQPSTPHQQSTPTFQEPHLDSGSIQSSGCTVHSPSELPSTVPKNDADCPDDLNSRLSRFVEHLQSVGYHGTDLKMNGLKLIHLFDCGGQLAFQDAIPCLIHAPSAFIVVFNASVHLEEEKEWTYCAHEGSEELWRGHKESQWNILLRIFSSIHSLQYKCHTDLKKLTQRKSSSQDESSNSWPIAVVGTHKASLKQHKDCAAIKKCIISHFAGLKSKPYCDMFLQGKPPDLVENTTMDDARRINELRKQISEDASFSLNLPLTWLYLELFTRSQHPKQLFISYKDLKALCLNGTLITNGDEEFNTLLRVLHALGFYAFFPLEDLGVPLDQNWVCTDAATLYREVSKLLMVQHTLDEPKTKAAEYLKSEGMIMLNEDSLQRLFNDLKISCKINGEIDRVFSPKWLILVLVYIGLAAKFKRGGREQVFIPLALPFKGCDLPPVTELSIATLCLTLEFPSGPSTGIVTPILTDMPCGIFPCLVVLLLSDREESKCPFEVAEESDRACIKLKPPDHKGDYRLYLKNHINYVEVALQVNETVINEDHEAAEKVYKLCEFLSQTLTSTLEDAFLKLFGEQPREKAVTARCGFKCTSCPASGKDHLTVMGNLEPQSFSCVYKQGKCPLKSRNCSQRIWFCPVPAAKFSVKTGTCCRIWVMDDPSSSACKRSPANTSSSVSKRHCQTSDSVPTAPMAGEDKINSSLDICGVKEYNKDLIGNMTVLGAVLGIGEETKAIINRPGTIDAQLLDILNRYIAKESPTWRDFCTALKRYDVFNNVREKIERDHHSST